MSIDWNSLMEEPEGSNSVQSYEAPKRLSLDAGMNIALKVKQLRVPKNRFVYNPYTMPDFMEEWDGKFMLEITFVDNANQELTYNKNAKHLLMIELKDIFEEIGYSIDESNQFKYLKPNVPFEVSLVREKAKKGRERFARVKIENWRSLE